jgi:hypothetical protein
MQPHTDIFIIDIVGDSSSVVAIVVPVMVVVGLVISGIVILTILIALMRQQRRKLNC